MWDSFLIEDPITHIANCFSYLLKAIDAWIQTNSSFAMGNSNSSKSSSAQPSSKPAPKPTQVYRGCCLIHN